VSHPTSKARSRKILAIDPHTRRIGYVDAVGTDLIDWGVQNTRRYRLAVRVRRVIIPSLVQMLDGYEPETLLVPAAESQYRRSQLVTDALAALVREARDRNVAVYALTIAETRQAFSLIAGRRIRNRFAIYEMLAERYPELSTMTPKHRKPWEPEPYTGPLYRAAAMLVAWQTLTGAN
jgi:hypothetical protein